jgi:hypothetical protein
MLKFAEKSDQLMVTHTNPQTEKCVIGFQYTKWSPKGKNNGLKVLKNRQEQLALLVARTNKTH